MRRSPTMTVRLKRHAKLHGAVYATTCAGLLDLMEKGHLACLKKGQAFVVFSMASWALR